MLTRGSPPPDFFSDGEHLSKSAQKWQWKCQHYDLKIHICIGSTGSGSGSNNNLKIQLCITVKNI